VCVARSRETENLEYLKNIVIHYMSADSAGREQLFSPIAAVLHFSKKEVRSLTCPTIHESNTEAAL